MAKPINHTPVLKGQDAINFLNKIEQNKNRKVEKEIIISIKEIAKKFEAILKNK